MNKELLNISLCNINEKIKKFESLVGEVNDNVDKELSYEIEKLRIIKNETIKRINDEK